MRSILEFLFPYILRRRLAREWADAVNNEVVVTDKKDAKWIVFQADGSIRYVSENLFARLGDIAYSKDMMWNFDLCRIEKMVRPDFRPKEREVRL